MSFRLVDKGWDALFADARKADASVVRLVCPFIQRKPIERLLSHGKPKTLQVITRFNLDDFCDKVSDMAALRLLLDHGASIRGIKHLHAKMYLLGTSRAIVTSANLTDKALQCNHEFGFVAEDPAIVRSCTEYFERLWARGTKDVQKHVLEEWGNRIAKHLAAGGPPAPRSSLGDFGADAGFDPESPAPAGWVAESRQAFVKLFGESTNRLPHDYPVINEVDRAGCHWACTYPRDKRPRQVDEGALMFMGRLVAPQDILVFGRGVGMSYEGGRDDATPEDVKKRDFKARWPHYIRVHHAEFVDGPLSNGVSLNELMKTLGSECFAATQRNRLRGEGNTDPRRAYRQQPAVELSEQGREWLTARLEEAFRRHGKQPDKVMQSLDWPKVPGMAKAGTA